MRVTIPVAIFTSLLLIGCPPVEAGDDAGSSSDAGTETDAATGDDAGGGDSSVSGDPNGSVCTQDSDCQSGLCLALFGVGNAYCSVPCASPDTCGPEMADGASYMCLGTAAGNVCVRDCATAACPTEHECLRNLGQDGDLDLCLDMRGLYCDSQADCAGGCGYLGTGETWINYCDTTDTAGQLMPGDACNSEGLSAPCDNTADCRAGLTCNPEYNFCEPDPADACGSGFCLQGYNVCGGPCTADADCPNGMACRTFEFTATHFTDDPADDNDTPVRVCFPTVGSRTPCTTDANCTGTERCAGFTNDSGTFAQVCLEPAAGAVATGETCRDDPTTEGVEEPIVPCSNELCVGYTCADTCQADADCGDPAAWTCVEGDAPGTFHYCVEGADCSTDADCTNAGEACMPVGSATGFAGKCQTANGDLAFGDSCEQVGWLAAGRSCVDDSACTDLGAGYYCDPGHECSPPRSAQCGLACLSNDVCTMLCGQDSDCGDVAEWMCAGFNLVYDMNGTGDPTDDTTGLVRACAWFPGSRTDCTRDADCATGGEVCRPHFAADGTPSLKCGTALPDGAAAGAACAVVGSEFVACANELCDQNDGDGDDRTGTCGAACVDDNDCPAGLTCQDYPIKPDLSVNVSVCRLPGAGGIAG